ncbi:MAG: right-handed parallel beta-helix repeat-containing protein, partial [Phycisphaerales bacterium]|nr:right-handed parallel beta-helix repeat-containing protein [Phycisphaerales bacterium]
MRMFQMTLVASLLLAGTSFADTINVPDDYPTIQGAVDAAADGDEIIVSPGTYSVGNTYEVVKMGGKAVWLHSSDGPETTIIDGSGDRRGIACVLGEGPGTIIEGFTIRNCDDGPDQGVGGGILVASDSSPTIRGCHVISSSAWWGGGIGIESSNPVFENCTISVCSSGYLGGGIALLSGSPVFESCTISSCSSDYGGGFGVDVGEGDAANPSFISCEMTGNTAKDGGGFYFENSHGLVEDCVVSGNSSTDEGGGVHVSYDSEVSISDCYISNNSSGVDPGGGIWNGLGGTSIVGGTTVCANSPGQIHGSWTDAGGNVVSAVCPVTLTVALDGSGDFTSIQSAIDAASSGDTILVEPGTYNEHEVNTNGKSVFIVGSVDSEGMPASVIDAAGSSQNVLLIRNGESPWYSNFIITNGSAGNGGAAFIDNASSPRFANCHFLNNTAGNESGALLCIDASLVLSKCLFTGNTAGHQGGAVGLFGTSHLQCYDSHFENNETGSGSGGGAISCDPGTSVEIENTSFANNIAGRAGGGIAIEANVNALIRDCVFTNNEALDAGGLYAHNCSPTVDSCQFVGNRCLNRGGGIGFFDGSGGSIVNCQILDNEVTAGYPSSYGGGIYLADSSPLITGCLVSGNSDPHAGGGLSASNSDAVLTSCVITDNSGAHGGVYLYQSAPQLIDCLIVENSGTATGGVAMDSSTPSFEGCAVVGNTGAECGGINDLGASTSSLLNTAVCGNAKGQVCDNYTDLGGNTVEEVCTDADGDGIADSYDNCYLYNPKQLDCNGNGIGDVCDLADQTSYDIDQNGVPDECDPDCDGDGIPDGADGPDFDQDG